MAIGVGPPDGAKCMVACQGSSSSGVMVLLLPLTPGCQYEPLQQWSLLCHAYLGVIVENAQAVSKGRQQFVSRHVLLLHVVTGHSDRICRHLPTPIQDVCGRVGEVTHCLHAIELYDMTPSALTSLSAMQSYVNLFGYAGISLPPI